MPNRDLTGWGACKGSVALSVASDTRARPDVVADVCARISAGESMRAIFRNPGDGYPHEVTFWRWIGSDADVRSAYDKAAADRSERYAEEIADLADETPERIETENGQKIDPSFEQWRKTRIDARKWIASKLVPKKYGDRTILSGDADNPLSIDVTDARAALLSGLTPKPAGNGTEGTGSGT